MKQANPITEGYSCDAARCKVGGRHNVSTLDGGPCPLGCREPTGYDCGGSCCLPRGHDGPHECIGDEPGQPGTCDA